MLELKANDIDWRLNHHKNQKFAFLIKHNSYNHLWKAWNHVLLQNFLFVPSSSKGKKDIKGVFCFL